MSSQTQTISPPEAAEPGRNATAWRGIATAALDLAFETDAQARLVAVAPGLWLGRDTARMIGQPLDALWHPAPQMVRIGGARPVRRRIEGIDADGRSVSLILSYNTMRDEAGAITGARGGVILVDDDAGLPAQVRQPSAATLRRVTETLRAAVVPRIGIVSAFEVLCAEMGATGAALISTCPLSPHEPAPVDRAFQILHAFGEQSEESARVVRELEPGIRTGALRRVRGAQDFLLARERVRLFGQLGILFWRPMAQPWSAASGALCSAVVSMFAALVELDGVHRNLLRDAHFDPSHNILTWKGFQAEIGRRIARLEREHLAATLMLVAIEGLPDLVARLGFADGESAINQCIDLLRAAVRPTDLIARVGSDTFALWMDGGDRFAAAERAERVCAHGAPVILDPPHHLPITMGLVAREPGADEPIETFLERASLALRGAREKGGGWLFSHDAP